MTYSITDSGVSVTRGRGAAKVSLVISFKDLEKWAKRQKVDTAKLMTKSFGQACKGLKDKFREVVTKAGGVCGVPKFKDFEDFTKQLRAESGKTAPMGGILSAKSSIVAFKRGGWQYVGWPDYLETVAEHFQDGYGGEASEKYFTDPKFRHFMHLRGVKDVPYQYVHNPRRVLPEPFGAYVQEHLEEWARGAFYKALAREMQKGALAA